MLDYTFAPQLPFSLPRFPSTHPHRNYLTTHDTYDEDDGMMSLSFYSDCDYRSGKRTRSPAPEPRAGPAVLAVVGGVLRGVWQMVRPRFGWGATTIPGQHNVVMTTFSETMVEEGRWSMVSAGEEPARRPTTTRRTVSTARRGMGRRTTVVAETRPAGKRRRVEEVDEVEMEMRRLETKMKSMIKEGRQALATKVEVVYDSDDEY